MFCDHDDQRCKVCTCCQQCYPHAVGYWDEGVIQGGCRDANIRWHLEKLEILEQAAGSVLARAQKAGNAAGERDAREVLDEIDGGRDRMLGTQDL